MVGSLIPSGVKPNVKSICAEVVRETAGAVRNVWGYNTSADHNGRDCIDYMINTRAEGDKIASYNIRHADRLKVAWIIWNGRIWRRLGAVGRPKGWSTYYGTNKHRDHPHIQYGITTYRPLADQPVKPPTFPVPKTCVVYFDLVNPGVTGSNTVYWIQRWLNNVPMPDAPAVKLDGGYGALTVAAAKEFQELLGDTARDGNLGPMQTRELYARARKENPELPAATFHDES